MIIINSLVNVIRSVIAISTQIPKPKNQNRYQNPIFFVLVGRDTRLVRHHVFHRVFHHAEQSTVVVLQEAGQLRPCGIGVFGIGAFGI